MNNSIEKEILSFQSQKDKNLSWSAEIYIDKKFDFCSMCQGADKLDKYRKKQELFLTLKVEEFNLGNKSEKWNAVNSFCRGCSEKKTKELRNNPRLKNPEKLKTIRSWLFN